MKLVTLLVTRSKACSVKTLHTVLRINLTCMQKGVDNEISYVDDDPFLKAEAIERYMKSHERIIFVDFGISLDEKSIAQCFEKHEVFHHNCFNLLLLFWAFYVAKFRIL